MRIGIALDVTPGTQTLPPEIPIRRVRLTRLGMLHVNRGALAAEVVEAPAATIFRTPDAAMRHAAILQAMGRTEEAAELRAGIHDDWPHLRAGQFASITIARCCRSDRFAGPLLDRYRNLDNLLNQNNPSGACTRSAPVCGSLRLAVRGSDPRPHHSVGGKEKRMSTSRRIEGHCTAEIVLLEC